ncbi:MAG: hypothetical protein MI725_10885 [Pirellulales bacterium]|nr:hypothetical protein [Pirellulales bacterium]
MAARALPVKNLWLVFWFAANAGLLYARDPSLKFDFGRLAECREIAPADSAEIFPDEKLVELKLRVSVHLLGGDIGDVKEVRIEASDCDSKIRVHSFAPSTRLESEFSADIKRTKTVERGKSLGASLGGAVPLPAGDLVAQVAPTIGGELSNREIVTEVEQRVAPQQAIVASGTIHQEHGVFFKLRASPQTALEGVHELTIRFVVPQNWRGDAVRVCCYATGHEKILWMKQETTWAQTCASVAVYLAGDLQARQAAQRHIKSATL